MLVVDGNRLVVYLITFWSPRDFHSQSRVFVPVTVSEHSGEAVCMRGYISGGGGGFSTLLERQDCQFVGLCGPTGLTDSTKTLLLHKGHTDKSVFIFVCLPLHLSPLRVHARSSSGSSY